ncbi:MAG: hypothetical protein MPW15_16865 [Candidatus Manganitrophus sp.]|nr:hypothetical protein [Candidatus Manganitrophus sp.]
MIGVKLLPEPQTRSDLGELLRTIGFASAPGLIRVLGIFPGMAEIVFFVAAIWMLVAMILAVRQALDYQSTLRAISVVAIGWIVQLAILVFALSMMQQPPRSEMTLIAPPHSDFPPNTAESPVERTGVRDSFSTARNVPPRPNR